MADWEKLRTEYITSDISYRSLAEKHGIPFKGLSKRAKTEDWYGKRHDYREKLVAKTISKVSGIQANRAARLQTAADKIMDKVFMALESAEDASDLRTLSRTLLDIKETLGIKSEADMKEQEARIENLHRQAQRDTQDQEITVRLETEEYAD